MVTRVFVLILLILMTVAGCSTKSSKTPWPPVPGAFRTVPGKLTGLPEGATYLDVEEKVVECGAKYEACRLQVQGLLDVIREREAVGK